MTNSCAKCLKLILEKNTTYGINPEAVCKCEQPIPIHGNVSPSSIGLTTQQPMTPIKSEELTIRGANQ